MDKRITWLTDGEWDTVEDRFRDELETQITGVTPQGFEPLVSWELLKDPLALVSITPDPERYRDLTCYDLEILYMVKRVELKDTGFKTTYLEGRAWLPWNPDTNEIDLDAVDAFEDLRVRDETTGLD